MYKVYLKYKLNISALQCIKMYYNCILVKIGAIFAVTVKFLSNIKYRISILELQHLFAILFLLRPDTLTVIGRALESRNTGSFVIMKVIPALSQTSPNMFFVETNR